MTADPSMTAADIMPAVPLSPERPGSAACTFPRPEPEAGLSPPPAHTGLPDVIAAFSAAGHEPRPGHVYPGPCDRTEPAARAGRQSPA